MNIYLKIVKNIDIFLILYNAPWHATKSGRSTDSKMEKAFHTSPMKSDLKGDNVKP